MKIVLNPHSGAIRFGIFFLVVAVLVTTQYACVSKSMDEQIGQLIQEKDYQGAADAYQSVIDSKPGTSEARQAQLGIAKLYIEKMDQPQLGIKVYQDLLATVPDSDEAAEAHWRLGLHAFKSKDYQAAQQSFDTIVNNFPASERSHNAQLMLAKSYEEASNYEKAAEVYDNVANRHPEGKRATQALVNKARIEQEYLNNQAAATQTYQSLVKQYGAIDGTEESVEEAKKALQLIGASIPRPDEPDAQELATEYSRRSNYRERRRAERDEAGFESSPATGIPKDIPESGFGVNPEEIMGPYKETIMQEGTADQDFAPEVYHDTVLKIAFLKLQFQEYRDAGALFFYAIELAKREKARIDPYSFLRLSVCYRKVGLYQRAAKVLREAVRRDVSVLEAVVVTGDNQYIDEEYERAIETYNSIVGLNRSKDPELYWRLGLVYQKMGNYEKEAEFCERAIASRTDYTDALQSLAYVLFRHLNDKNRARIFDELARGQSNSYEGEIELGAICYKYGNYTWAKTKYQAAARFAERQKKDSMSPPEQRLLGSRIVYAKVHAAMAFYKNGMEDKGQEIFDALAAEYPDHPLTSYGNGQLALLKGDTDTAIAEFKASMEKDPKSHAAPIALGEYYLSQGYIDEAKALWSGFLKANPRNRVVRQRLGTLNRQLEAGTSSN
ncbi:tetratricopeptide repeat protein [Candidatus Poribacteria bacterium]|nr:tetratricopeptide repeat protein [Candidatus Poribacteria bacterium]